MSENDHQQHLILAVQQEIDELQTILAARMRESVSEDVAGERSGIPLSPAVSVPYDAPLSSDMEHATDSEPSGAVMSPPVPEDVSGDLGVGHQIVNNEAACIGIREVEFTLSQKLLLLDSYLAPARGEIEVEIHRLLSRIRELDLATVDFATRTDECGSAIERIQHENSCTLEVIGQTGASISSLKEQLAENARQCEVLHTRADSIRTEIDAITGSIAENDDTLRDLRDVKTQHSKKLADLHDLCLAATERVEALKVQMIGMEDRVEAHTTQCRDFAVANSELSITLRGLQDAASHHVTTLEFERIESQNTEADMRTTQCQIDKVAMGIARKENALADIRSETERATKELHQLQSELAGAKVENSSLKRRESSGVTADCVSSETQREARLRESQLETDLAELVASRNQLEHTVASASAANTRTRGRTELLDRKIKSLCDSLVLTEVDRRKSEASVKSKTGELQALSALSTNVKKYKLALVLQIKQRNEKVSSLKSKHALLSAGISDMQSEVAAKTRAAKEGAESVRTLRHGYDQSVGEKNTLMVEARNLSSEIEKNVTEIDRLTFWLQSGERVRTGLGDKLVAVKTLVSRDVVLVDRADVQKREVSEQLKQLHNERESTMLALAELDSEIRAKILDLAEVDREIRIVKNRIPQVDSLRRSLKEAQDTLAELTARRKEMEVDVESRKLADLKYIGGGAEMDAPMLDSRISRVLAMLEHKRSKEMENGLILADLTTAVHTLRDESAANNSLFTRITSIKSRLNRQSRSLLAAVAELAVVQAGCNQLVTQLEGAKVKLSVAKGNQLAGLPPTVECPALLQRELMQRVVRTEAPVAPPAEAGGRRNTYVPESNLLGIPKPFLQFALPFKPFS